MESNCDRCGVSGKVRVERYAKPAAGENWTFVGTAVETTGAVGQVYTAPAETALTSSDMEQLAASMHLSEAEVAPLISPATKRLELVFCGHCYHLTEADLFLDNWVVTKDVRDEDAKQAMSQADGECEGPPQAPGRFRPGGPIQ